MMSLRPPTLILCAVLLTAAPGCRTAGLRDTTRPDALALPRVTESAAELLSEHNLNAQRIKTLEAKPSITVSQGLRRGGVSGNLAFARQRDFKLVLNGPINQLADIGSNDREFWFWIKDAKEPGVYFCNYDETGQSPLASSLQPDWIVEALGLRTISADEASRIQVKPGTESGALILTQKVRHTQGQTFIKETVLSESTRRIREHRILSEDRKTQLARAVISEYEKIEVAEEAGGPTEVVMLPKRLRLEWSQEGFTLDVTLKEIELNPEFSAQRRAELFIEPAIAGLDRKDLAELAGVPKSTRSASRDDRTSVRQSMPAPPPRVRLSEPAPLGDRAVPHGLANRAAALAANLPPANARGVEEVIGPQIPSVADPAPVAVQANTGWRSSLSQNLER